MPVFNTVFTVFSGIGFTLSVIPLWWHLQSWNTHVGTCMYMIWTALGCLVHFVDSIVWNGNVVNWAPVWCDISSHIKLGVSVAWPACGLCITRRLYNITVLTTPDPKRRETIIDLLIAVGIPVVQMVAQYVVSGHRFNIYEDYGCGPATWNTPLAYVLVYSWPLIIAIASACYGALTIRTFLKQRRGFRQILSNQSRMMSSYYWRLMALASLDFCFTIPLASWGIAQNLLLSNVSPWVSWNDTHWEYSRVFQFPRTLLDQKPIAVYSLETTRWAAVLCAFVFFGFFGFSEEPRTHYRLLASTLAKIFGCEKFAKDAATPVSSVQLSFRFAPRAQQTKSISDSDSFVDRRSTLHEPCPKHGAQPFPITEQSSSYDSLSLADYKAPRAPEPAVYPASVRKVSVLGSVE